jgi:hypothetical protein
MVSVIVNMNSDVLEKRKAKAAAEGKDVGDIAGELLAERLLDDDYELSPDDEARIAEGMEQLERGESVDEDVVMAKLRSLR